MGVTLPYPMVASVSTLKKNARQNALPMAAGVVPTSESFPHARYASANTVFTATYPLTTIAPNRRHDIVRK